jgi:IS4 transposase
LLDREFFKIADQKLLNNLRLKYIMPCTAYKNIKDFLEYTEAPFVVENFEMGKGAINYNMVAIKKSKDDEGFNYDERDGDDEEIKGIHAFGTNLPIDPNKPEIEGERIANLYRSRWGIETGYRVKTHTFRPKTSSKDYRIRIFYFYFSILMYNLWILADMLVWIALCNKVGETHLIKAKFFRKQFSLIDPGG